MPWWLGILVSWCHGIMMFWCPDDGSWCQGDRCAGILVLGVYFGIENIDILVSLASQKHRFCIVNNMLS